MAIRRSIFLASVRFARNGLDVQEITDFPAISESEALKLKKISPAGTHHHRRVSQKNYSNLSVGVLFEYSQSASLPAQKPGGKLSVLRSRPRIFCRLFRSFRDLPVLCRSE
jgi:hypothetical protein